MHGDHDDERPEGEGPTSAPLHPWLAGLWATGVLFVAALLMGVIGSVRPDSRDPVLGHAAFALAILLGIFGVLRVHAPTRELAASLALRPSAVLAFGLAAVAGLALVAVDDWVFGLIARLFPLSDEEKQLFSSAPVFAGRIHEGVYVIFAVALSPAFEELFFRGALQTGVRRHGASVAIVSCGLAFGLFHVFGGLRYVLVASVAGLVLGALRELSGSSLVSLTAHIVTNGVQVFLVLAGFGESSVGHTLGAISCAAVLLVLGALALLSRRSARIQASRAEDLA